MWVGVTPSRSDRPQLPIWGKITCRVETSVKTVTTTAVAHAMTLKHRLLVQRPISRLLLIKSNMRTRTTGSNTPLSTWE